MTSEYDYDAAASDMRHYRMHLAASRLAEQFLICHAVVRHAESDQGPGYERAVEEHIRTFEAALSEWRKLQAVAGVQS